MQNIGSIFFLLIWLGGAVWASSGLFVDAEVFLLRATHFHPNGQESFLSKTRTLEVSKKDESKISSACNLNLANTERCFLCI